MIHPGPDDPVPTIISISYGWGPDDTTEVFTEAEFAQISQLFQDAANLSVNDTGAGGPAATGGGVSAR